MKHGKAYRIFITVLGALLIAVGLLLLIASPVAGAVGILAGILVILAGRKFGKQPQEQPVSTLEELVKKYPPIGGPQPEAASEPGEKHYVAGTSYRQTEIASLGRFTDEYQYTRKELIESGLVDEKIYEKTFSPREVQLVEEPDNPHDPNAVKVVIDGVHVGYIKKGSTAHIKKLLGSGAIKKITAWIGGGKYKIVESEYDDEADKETYILESGETDYTISIRIITE